MSAAAQEPSSTSPTAPPPIEIEKSQAPREIPHLTPVSIPTPTPDPEKVVLCLVDDRRLTQAMVNKILTRLLKGKKRTTDYLERLRVVYTQNIMMEWLNRNLLAAEAEAEGITVTDDEIHQQEAALKSAANIKFEIDKALETIGASKAEYRKQLRDALLGEKLVNRRIRAYYAEKDLRKIYLKNPREFQRPPRVRASHVFCPLHGNETPEQKKARGKFMERARSQAKRGKDLRQVAKSADASWGVIGGDLGWLYPLNRLPQPINSLVFKVKVGKVSNVVESRYGYYVIRVEEKKPLSGITYEEARETVLDAVFNNVRKKVLDVAKRTHKVRINISGIPEDKL